jgi:hypothetical protein
LDVEPHDGIRGHRQSRSRRAEEVTVFEGIPIVTPERAIRDSYAADLGAALIRQAIDGAVRRGLISAARADLLRDCR